MTVVPLLSVKELSVNFGGLLAVNNVSFDVLPGEVFSLIGPNGAGKTTVFNLISRVYRPTEGSVTFGGRELTTLAPHRIADLGIARTFQNIELFEHATVLQNLLVGRHRHRRPGVVEQLFFTGRVRKGEVEARRKVEEVIDFLDLQHYRDSVVGSVPYGVRKIVELARALCTEPKLLLLDEPSSGLNVEETEDMAFWIEDIRREFGIAVLMVEHDMNLVAKVSDRVLALSQGAVVACGSAHAVQTHPEVIESYMGPSEDSGASAPAAARPVADADVEPLLQLQNVECAYGPVKAIRGVSLQVRPGEIATVLGSNGAGKTTILKAISGIVDPLKGSIHFKRNDIARTDPADIVRRGLVHVPEGREIFPLMSVRDNLEMGAYTRADRDAVGRDMETVYGYFPVLRSRSDQNAGLLSGGQLQMLAISRALMAAPELILLDEPSLGLSPRLTKEIFEIILRINRERGTAILLVEQNAHMALNAADFGYVLENGRIVMEDACARLREKDDIKEFYLGMKKDSVRGERRWKRKKTWR